jgi:hypothetical protein
MTTLRRIAAAVLLTIFGPAMRRYDNQIANGVNDLDDQED